MSIFTIFIIQSIIISTKHYISIAGDTDSQVRTSVGINPGELSNRPHISSDQRLLMSSNRQYLICQRNELSCCCYNDKTRKHSQSRLLIIIMPGYIGLESVGSNLGNSGLYSLMGCHNLQHLHLANTDLFRIDFDEGLAPVLSVCGSNLGKSQKI